MQKLIRAYMDDSRTDAPADLELTIAGPADPIDALQVDPEDAETELAEQADAPEPGEPDTGEPVDDSIADTPFEMVEDEYVAPVFVGDPIEAILKGPPAASAEIDEPAVDELVMEEVADAAEAPVPDDEDETVDEPAPSDLERAGSEEDAEQDAALIGAGAAAAGSGRTGAWWTLPLMFAGIGIVACALLVPAADENRRAMYELEKINRDVAYFERQSAVNKEFLERVSSDPNLAERLALRQLRMTRSDAKLAPLPGRQEMFGMSPSALVTLDPPGPLPEYQSLGGFLGRWFLDTRRQMYFCGAGLLMVAAGLIFGGGSPTPRPTA